MMVMHHESTEITKDKTEAFITWLEQALLTLIDIKTNDGVQKRYKKKSIYEN